MYVDMWVSRMHGIQNVMPVEVINNIIQVIRDDYALATLSLQNRR